MLQAWRRLMLSSLGLMIINLSLPWTPESGLCMTAGKYAKLIRVFGLGKKKA